MSCQIKNIPQEALYIVGTGNRGGGFPKESICEALSQPTIEPPPVAQECYLAMELSAIDPSYGPDQTFSPIVLVGNPLYEAIPPYEPPLDLYISAPCVGLTQDCYLALEENGLILYELEQTQDNFSATCLQ